MLLMKNFWKSRAPGASTGSEALELRDKINPFLMEKVYIKLFNILIMI